MAGYVRDAAREYGHVVELTHLPSVWSEWVKTGLKDYAGDAETCMGQKYTRVTKRYTLITNGDTSVFLFLKSATEKESVLRAFPRAVANENPFKTLID